MQRSLLFGEVATMKKTKPRVSQVDKIQQLNWKKLRSYKMYQQILQNQSLLSQQSSDIALSQQQPSRLLQEQTFLPAIQQISNVKLYRDLPLSLLREPEYQTEEEASREAMLFQDTNQFFIFDSIVFNASMMDQMIMEERRNKQLKLDIQMIDKYQKQYEDLERVLNGSLEGKKNSIKDSQKIFNKIDTRTEKLLKHINPSAWFEDYNKMQQLQTSATKLIKQTCPEEKKSLQDKVKTLKNTKKRLIENSTRLQQDIQRLEAQIQFQRQENKKQHIAVYVAKQSRQITKLRQSIRKMEQAMRKIQDNFRR